MILPHLLLLLQAAPLCWAGSTRAALITRLLSSSPLVPPLEDGPVTIHLEMVIYDIIGLVRPKTNKLS